MAANTLDLGTMLFGEGQGFPIELTMGLDTMSIIYLALALFFALLAALFIFGIVFK